MSTQVHPSENSIPAANVFNLMRSKLGESDDLNAEQIAVLDLFISDVEVLSNSDEIFINNHSPNANTKQHEELQAFHQADEAQSKRIQFETQNALSLESIKTLRNELSEVQKLQDEHERITHEARIESQALQSKIKNLQNDLRLSNLLMH